MRPTLHPGRPSGDQSTTSLFDALERAEAHASLTGADAAVLMTARGAELDRLLELASDLRDQGLRARGQAGIVTYSRKVFVPVTTLCRDRCHYCVFVDTPGQLAAHGKAPYLTPDQVVATAEAGAAAGCKEVLFTLGDRPEERWPSAAAWLDEHGYASTVDYLRALGELVIAETGLLPHMNPGVMTWREMQVLRPVSPSMGMMLETVATRLWDQPGGVHFGSPDKDPVVRLRALEDAGSSCIPFSTGVLLGIGESLEERAQALFSLRAIQERFGHLQEVIVQNLRVKPATAMQNERDLELEDYAASIAVARLVMGPDMTIQAPPNLSAPGDLSLLLAAGVDDWGGVSPLTPDHVNPERPWPHLDALADLTASSGFTLTERLTAHPQYVREAGTWIDPRLHRAVTRLAHPVTGLAAVGSGAVGTDHTGGGAHLHLQAPLTQSRSPERLDPGVAALLDRAAQHPAGLSDQDYQDALTWRGPALTALTGLADALREEAVGDVLTFVANRNIDSTSFRVDRPAAPQTWGSRPALSDGRLSELAAEAWQRWATEICLQGAPPPAAGPDAYGEIVRALRAGAADLHVHAFRPPELIDGARRAGLSLGDHLQLLREAGLRSVPGTVALILDDGVRSRLAGGASLSSDLWEETIRGAHRAGLRSTATIVYGHVETPADVVAHLGRLRRLQEETGGFTELIPMPYSSTGPGDPLGLGPDLDTSRALHAVARLMLHGRISHIQAAWTRLGMNGATQVLRSGADDAGGLLFGGGLEPFAGAEAGRELSVPDLAQIAAELGRTLQQRMTDYSRPTTERETALSSLHRPAGPLVRAVRRPLPRGAAAR